MKTKITGKIIKTNKGYAVLASESKRSHRIYGKQFKITKRVQVADPEGKLAVGDSVQAVETRPLSKTIHWEIFKILG